MDTQLIFSNDWFMTKTSPTWAELFVGDRPSKILEIGCYEGAATCFAIQHVASFRPLEIHCIDSWEGGLEAAGVVDMSLVESRFRANTANALSVMPHPVDLIVHKGRSDLELAKLLATGMQGYFDFIYVDASHQACDVLVDAVLAFKLLRLGGVLAFDDYLWAEAMPYGIDPIRSPKIAIDAFTMINCRKISYLNVPNIQVYVRKQSD